MSDGPEPTYASQLVTPFWPVLSRYPQLPPELLQGLREVPAEQRFDVADGQRFLQKVVEMTGEPDLGLLAAQETRLGGFDVLEYVAFSAPSRRQSIEAAFRYVRLMNGAADFRIEVQGGRATIVLESTVPLTRAGIDFQSGALYQATSRWSGERPDELEVWFTYPEPADTSRHAETFDGAKLRFDAPYNGFIFPAAELDKPMHSSDPAAHGVLRAHLETMLAKLPSRRRLVEEVRGQLLEELKGGTPTAEALAARMGITRRTLTRRLAREGTTFSRLLTEVRKQAALHYLEHSDHSLDDIAFLLGFSESSAFVRAFQRWLGTTPAAHRRRLRS